MSTTFNSLVSNLANHKSLKASNSPKPNPAVEGDKKKYQALGEKILERSNKADHFFENGKLKDAETKQAAETAIGKLEKTIGKALTKADESCKTLLNTAKDKIAENKKALLGTVEESVKKTAEEGMSTLGKVGIAAAVVGAVAGGYFLLFSGKKDKPVEDVAKLPETPPAPEAPPVAEKK